MTAHQRTGSRMLRSSGLSPGDRNDRKVPEETLAKFKRLFAVRNQYPALQSGELTWINNTSRTMS